MFRGKLNSLLSSSVAVIVVVAALLGYSLWERFPILGGIVGVAIGLGFVAMMFVTALFFGSLALFLLGEFLPSLREQLERPQAENLIVAGAMMITVAIFMIAAAGLYLNLS